MVIAVGKLLCASPLRLGDVAEADHGAIPEGYTVGAEIFGTSWSEALKRDSDLFECPLCHDYDFVLRGKSLYRHS